MPISKERSLDILARLGAAPATSFSEDGVTQVVEKILGELGIEYQVDSFGNIIATLKANQPPTGDEPPIAFMAHMDHPGFEVVGTDGDFLVGKALGGVPPGGFAPGRALHLVLEGDRRLQAAVVGRHGAEEDREILIKIEEPQPVPVPTPVVFDLVDFQLDGEFIRMRALDDLAGCGSILAALGILAGESRAVDVYGVFTRAEEVGLVGARLMAEAKTLPENTLVVSLESSRTLPGAEIGGGPVIRVGDAASTFSAEAEAALIKAREVLQGREQPVKIQRQLMSGGTCEASAFSAQGYRATGIAFPLGNYHNGAPDDGIEAEFIHQDDFLGGIELIAEAVRQVPFRNDTVFQRRIRQVPEEFRRRLSR